MSHDLMAKIAAELLKGAVKFINRDDLVWTCQVVPEEFLAQDPHYRIEPPMEYFGRVDGQTVMVLVIKHNGEITAAEAVVTYKPGKPFPSDAIYIIRMPHALARDLATKVPILVAR